MVHLGCHPLSHMPCPIDEMLPVAGNPAATLKCDALQFADGFLHRILEAAKSRKEAVMNLVRWDPFRELEGIQVRLNHLFGGAPVTGDDDRFFANWTPPVDIQETEKEYIVKADLLPKTEAAKPKAIDIKVA
jgi:hypothetical protein